MNDKVTFILYDSMVLDPVLIARWPSSTAAAVMQDSASNREHGQHPSHLQDRMQLKIVGGLVALCGRLALRAGDRLHPARHQKALALRLRNVVPLKPPRRRERPPLGAPQPPQLAVTGDFGSPPSERTPA